MIVNPEGQHVLELILTSISGTSLLVAGFFLKSIYKDYLELKKENTKEHGEFKERLTKLETINEMAIQ